MTYLHYYDPNIGDWAPEGDGVAVLPNDSLYKDYPGGYKYCLPRLLTDAPEWVKRLVEDSKIR